MHCVDSGALNKVSVFPNFVYPDSEFFSIDKEVEFSLHLNLVEGVCLSDPQKLGLLVHNDGRFKHSFVGLFKISLTKRKEFEIQVYEELKAQIRFWKNIKGEETSVLIDSHQHTHMIPVVFKTLIKVLNDENVKVKYLRIPSEPVLPFIMTPSLYYTYRPVNIIKQWLLKFLWQINKKEFKETKIPTAYFFGILFSGKMDEKRVNKILPHYIKKADKNHKDIEILFHPGYIKERDISLNEGVLSFEKFYLSSGRKTEFDTVISLYSKNNKKEEIINAVY